MVEEVRCILVELPKIPSVVGRKNLQKVEGILMVEEVRCKLVTWCSGKQGKEQQGG